MGPVTARRVLVVDDNQDSASSTAFLLEAMGHETRTVTDGLEAIACAASFRPDLIFMDLGLPTIDGFEAAARIRAEPWGRNIRIVALTGWAPAAVGAQPIAFDLHLVKPVRPADLAAAIATIAD
jgi:CheY-like chemotaxis protein